MSDRDDRCDLCGEYNVHRLCEKCFKENELYNKKQGALEELLKIHKKLYQKGSTKESWHQTIDSFINKRVKELDGVKNEC